MIRSPSAFLFAASIALLGATALAAQARAPEFPQTFVLTDGTEVVVDEPLSVVVRNGGRTVFETSPSQLPETRRFVEDFTPRPGLWDFERSFEERVVLDEFRRARLKKRGEAVVIRLRSGKRTGNLKPRRDRALLKISPEVPGESTTIELEVYHRRGHRPIDAVAMPLACDAEASFYGFGEQYNGADQRGEAFPLFLSEQGIRRIPDAGPGIPDLVNGNAHTTYFPMPYFLDARGFGLLAITDHRVDVDLCATDTDTAWIEVVDHGPVVLRAFHGPTMPDVIRQLGDVVGRPQSPPLWAWSLWVSAQGGQQAVLDDAQALRDAGVPASALWVQDWTGAPDEPLPLGGDGNIYYRWETDTSHYPDLPGLIDTIGEMGFRFLGYVNPFVDVSLQHFEPMRDAGWLLRRPETLEAYEFFGPLTISALPDLTIPEAREHIKDFMREMVTDIGMDGWMSDYGEWAPINAVYADGSDPVAMHQTYANQWHRLWREVMDELRPDGDFAVFSRAGWTGAHADAMIYWAGDQQTNWDEFDGIKTVIPAMVTLGLSGIPFVTHDIGGYSGFTIPRRNKELFQRWTELGAFSPLMRTHDGEHRTENWQWDSDAETTAHFARFARIHDVLIPELLTLAAQAESTSMPIVRHPMLVFPDDPSCRTIDDQYMLGDGLLVAPVLDEGAVTRSVYFPAGATWFDVWSGTSYAGGQTVVVPAPMGSPPVFSRDADRTDLRSVS